MPNRTAGGLTRRGRGGDVARTMPIACQSYVYRYYALRPDHGPEPEAWTS
jgi:hypothetical protein